MASIGSVFGDLSDLSLAKNVLQRNATNNQPAPIGANHAPKLANGQPSVWGGGTASPTGGTTMGGAPAPAPPRGPVTPAPGQWVGVPQNGVASTTTRSSQAGVAGALGLTPEEIAKRQAQTGVDPGATGYVSGQTTPGVHSALDALSAPGGTTMIPRGTGASGPAPAPATAPNPIAATNAGDARNITARGAALVTPGASTLNNPAGDVTTRTSGLSAPATGGTPVAVQRNPGGTTTVQSGLTNSSTGTTQGTSLIPQGINTGNSTIDQGVDAARDYLTPKLGDTGPAAAAQRATFGLSDDLNQERYDYRPGAASSQGVVSLDEQRANETRARQAAALDAIHAAANGTVPSAAELQMRQEAGRNVAATLGQARALGGRSAGGAARAGTLASADILNKTNVEGSQLRAAEQDRNRQAELTALGGVRGQDVDTAAKEAGLTQEAYANNLRAQLEQNALAEKHRQDLLDAQLRALGIGAGSANAVVQGGMTNAQTENKFKGGGLGALGDIIGAL